MTPAPVCVSWWGELPAEKKLPGVLRVLVDGQHVGGFQRQGRVWVAVHHARVSGAVRTTEHEDAHAAVQAVLRSGFARRLGARVASPVHWTGRARRIAGIRS